MPLTVTDCKVTTNSIEITFSDPIATKDDANASLSGSVPGTPAWTWATLPGGGWLYPLIGTPQTSVQKKLNEHLEHSALNPNNYVVSNPQSVDFTSGSGHTNTALSGLAKNVNGPPFFPLWQPSSAPPSPTLPGGLNASKSWAWISLDHSRTTVTIHFVAFPFLFSPVTSEFQPDSWVTIAIRNIRGLSEAGDEYPELEGNFALLVRQVPNPNPGLSRKTRDIEDAISYPILTEEVSYPPSTLSRPGGRGGSGGGGGGGQGLAAVASQAIGEVLGWKTSAQDAKGFVGALTQSFSLVEVEGRTESKWIQKTYTVQTDLAGGITGAQASLYARAQVAQEKCLPLLDGLYPLDPRADPEYVAALRGMAKSQITEIVKQFGVVPPSILRVNTYFHILLGVDRKSLKPEHKASVETDPDLVGGTLGDIRKIFGVYFQRHGQDNPLSNSVDDEQNITNFRVISDYVTSLLLTWLGNFDYFKLTMGKAPAFLGTQLILISRQFNVIAETVNEARFTLDSVFIGPNERQQLLLVFPDGHELPAMYLEDVLTEIEATVTDEGPRLIKDGGRIALYNNVLPVVQTLMNMVEGARHPGNIGELPDGFRTARVRHSLDDLRDQLTYLYTLAQQVGMAVPRVSQQ